VEIIKITHAGKRNKKESHSGKRKEESLKSNAFEKEG
jgi:hypothetical protein